MARTGGNLSELKPVKTCLDFIRRIPVLSTLPIFITAKQTRNINKQLYAKVFQNIMAILSSCLFMLF